MVIPQNDQHLRPVLIGIGEPVNCRKSKAMLFNNWHDQYPFAIRLVYLKMLGIWFSWAVMCNMNWVGFLAEVKQKLDL